MQAFAQVTAPQHTRYSRVVQQLGQSPTAIVERIVRQAPPQDAQVVAQSERGAFAGGFSGPSQNTLTIEDLAEHIVEEDPAHLSTRFSEDFVYQTLPDTVLWNRPVQVIAIRARTNAAQPVQYARYYLDQETVVAIYIERVRRTLFFSENTRYYLQIRPHKSGAWVPYHAHVYTELALPLRPVRRLGRTTTLYGYGALTTAGAAP